MFRQEGTNVEKQSDFKFSSPRAEYFPTSILSLQRFSAYIEHSQILLLNYLSVWWLVPDDIFMQLQSIGRFLHVHDLHIRTITTPTCKNSVIFSADLQFKIAHCHCPPVLISLLQTHFHFLQSPMPITICAQRRTILWCTATISLLPLLYPMLLFFCELNLHIQTKTAFFSFAWVYSPLSLNALFYRWP